MLFPTHRVVQIQGYGHWHVSNSLTVDFCLEAVEQAMRDHGKPEIFNTDQGSQFGSQAFVELLAKAGVVQSMDGKGCWRDNSMMPLAVAA